MIQRLQSLLLLAAAAINCAVLAFPIWIVETTEEGRKAVLYGTRIELPATSLDPEITIGEDFMLLVHVLLIILSSAFMVFVIFNFRDRIRQARLTYIGLILLCFQIVVSVVLSNGLAERMNLTESNGGEFEYGFFAPILALALSWYAARRMKQDEEMVRSADRFR